MNNPNWLQFKNNMDQINYYQNVRTKLTIIQKYKNQSSIFA